MDSLTQIVLGAAVGQAVTGKKLGNRAMLWGAIAGTIPDLDIIGNFFMSEVDALAFHRGISHSFFFAIVASVFLAWYTSTLYKNKWYKQNWYKYLTTAAAVSFIGIFALALNGIINLSTGGDGSILGMLGVGLICVFLAYRLWINYTSKELDEVPHDFKLWYKLFFWAIFTHPILDCFTTYGTQIFAPFSKMRVSFDNISVADPGYTLPFLLCLLIAAFMPRLHPKRNWINWLGIILSSIYMMWTFYNKSVVNEVLENTLAEQGIEYNRYMTSPTILNNLLWSATVELDSVYYQGDYSLLDEDKRFKLTKVPKNEYLLEGYEQDHTVETLKWFSGNYYSIITRSDGRLQINDMRFGTVGNSRPAEDRYIFSFILEPNDKGSLELTDSQGGRPEPEERVSMMSDLFNRIRGQH